MKIRARMIQKRHVTTSTWGTRNLFEKYKVTNMRISENGTKYIEVTGPKQTYTLVSTMKKLQIVIPPEKDGEKAIKKEVPFFYVSPMTSSGKIQGADFFAEIDGELVAYRSIRGNSVTPL